MAYYYSRDFTSPQPIYAIIKEEFKSYFDTGAIDDVMFPVYLDKCLRKLGKTSYPIKEDILVIDGYQARLPDNFVAVREAWWCAESEDIPYQSATSFYSQAASSTTIQISPLTIGGQDCSDPECVDGCPKCMPQIAQSVYKTTVEKRTSFTRLFMLKPGNITSRKGCDVEYMKSWGVYSNPYSSSGDSFDVRGNKFTVNFETGVVYLVYYAIDMEECGNQLIPNNYRIMEYIEAFIKYKLFETLLNQIHDETYNQLEKKFLYYKGLADEAYILAETEIKKQTVWEKQRRMIKSRNRFNRFEIPNRTQTRWRR